MERLDQHDEDSYAGVPLSKFPEDLRVYEHLLWEGRANVVIEIGTLRGASALWFRDRLRTQAAYGRSTGEHKVISIDVEADRARPHLDRADPDWQSTITLISADIREPDLPGRVATLVPEGARCFVVEDCLHVYDTTMAALRGFARFVQPGGFFVVEDGYVDIDAMRKHANAPRGVLPAVSDWLASPDGGEFILRRDLELYGITCAPSGVLQRRARSEPA
jgi:cephalosporin hydroxylase